jgi:hypothetical protein
VKEAGGGDCGWGGWVEFVAKGGVQFRAAEGRKNIEGALARVKEAMAKDPLPPNPF